MRTYRLAPGAYCETPAAGIGVGARTDDEDWANIRPGAWVEAKVGDRVTFIPARVSANWKEESVLEGEPRWWLDFITARLNLEKPLAIYISPSPASASIAREAIVARI